MSEYHRPRDIGISATPEERRARQDAFKEAYLRHGRNVAAVSAELRTYSHTPHRWARAYPDFKEWWDEQQAIVAQEIEDTRDYRTACFMQAYIDNGHMLAHAALAVGVSVWTLQEWVKQDPELEDWLFLQRLLRVETGDHKLWELAMNPSRRDGGTLLRTALERRRESIYYIEKGTPAPQPSGGVVREDHTLPAGRDNGN